MIKNYAPIALFVYNRPNHTAKTLDFLCRCRGSSQSMLFVFSDGPKKPEDEVLVAETREVIRKSHWPGKTYIIESLGNKGLANSIISGVTKLVDEYDRVIVLEDDLLVAPCFLEYMNHSLERYAQEEKVLQVSGYMFPVNIDSVEDTFFMPQAPSWGWATWKRAWDLFDENAKDYKTLLTDKSMRKKFDLNGSYPYTDMMVRQMEGKIDSWAIRWYWSFFKAEGLCLFPKKSLVINIGMDGSGTHCGNISVKQDLSFVDIDINKKILFPAKISSNSEAFIYTCNFIKKRESLFVKLKRRAMLACR